VLQKSQSPHAIDARNFCDAGIQTGLGPLISILYKAGRHWNPGQIALLPGVRSITGMVSRTFLGKAVDETQPKRVAPGTPGIAGFPSLVMHAVVQNVIGVAVTVFPEVTSASPLGMVETRSCGARPGLPGPLLGLDVDLCPRRVTPFH
jgi:hypothetical protein